MQFRQIFLLPHREEEVALFTMVQQQKSDEITSDVSYPSCRGMMLRSYKVEITASTNLVQKQCCSIQACTRATSCTAHAVCTARIAQRNENTIFEFAQELRVKSSSTFSGDRK